MKVLITSPSLDETENVSGISTVVRQILENADADFVHFAAGRKDGERFGIAWVFKQIVQFPKFYFALRNEKIEILHVNATLTPLSILRDSTFVKIALFADVPVLLHVHGGRYLIEEFKSKPLSKIAEKMFRCSKTVLVLSKLEKGLVEERWKNINLRVLENAVSLEHVRPRKPETVQKTIIFLGRLHESKGLHEIIETCQVLKKQGIDFQFRAFGAGDLKEVFVIEMSKLLGDGFFFGGVISGERKWNELSKSDIFLLPSRHGEGLPMAMLEAMASGNAVIVSEMASIGEVIQDGINGFKVEPGNVDQIVEKLRILLSDKINWLDLRKRAKATVEESYNLTDYVKNLDLFYTEILK